MKITFVCENFTKSSVIMQPWKHIFEISKRFIRNGNSVSIITGGFPKLPREEEISGMHVYRLRKKTLIFDRDELLKSLNENEADIVNWHSGPMSAIYFCWLHELIRKNIVWTIYSGKFSWEDLRNVKAYEILSLNRFWYFFLLSLFPDYILKKGASIHQIRRLITKTKRQKDYLVNAGIPEKKIVVIPSGVDTDKFNKSKIFDKCDVRDDLGFFPDDFVALYFGPPSRFRGSDTVLKAVPLVLKEVKSSKFLILFRQTSCRNKSKLVDYVSRKYRSIKVVNGVLDEATLIRFLAVADIVVLPFKFWPATDVPLVILEAMAMGKPVITCPVGGIPEIIKHGETGILVSPNSPESVANALIELWKQEDLARKIGERARKYISKHHTWDNVAQQTMLLFKASMT